MDCHRSSSYWFAEQCNINHAWGFQCYLCIQLYMVRESSCGIDYDLRSADLLSNTIEIITSARGCYLRGKSLEIGKANEDRAQLMHALYTHAFCSIVKGTFRTSRVLAVLRI